jgi:membrane associated rhomboid family serine protease
MFPMTPWVKRLLIANVAMALVTGNLIGPVLGGLGRDIYTLLLLYPPAVLFRPWTVVTYMFLHAGAAHLFFNMIGLIFFGPRLESRLGSKGFLLLYLVSGLGGAAFSLVFAREAAVVGASGAVYGVLLAFAMFWPRAQMIVFPIPAPVEARFVIGAYLVLSIVQGVGGLASGIAHFAHLGGAAFGFAFLRWWEWRKGARKRAFQQKTTPEATPTGLGSDRVALARWRGISIAGLHELNRGEVERLIAKAERDGPASLTRTERDFLDRMSVR